LFCVALSFFFFEALVVVLAGFPALAVFGGGFTIGELAGRSATAWSIGVPSASEI
jgi:hypothetical protein